jgi:hypothetical protein
MHTQERKNIEGSLFLLKRKTSPRFQIAVLNKLSTDNYRETIHGAFDVEVSSPYLMYTLGDGMVCAAVPGNVAARASGKQRLYRLSVCP